SNGSISLDVQGFVFWEGPWHWEIHPFTAWRLSSSVTPPSAPQNLEAVAGDANVGLSWQAPASDGGSPITNYQIYRGTTAGGATFLATVGDVLTYSDTNVTNGQSYYTKSPQGTPQEKVLDRTKSRQPRIRPRLLRTSTSA